MAVETPPVWIQAGGETAERARRANAAMLPGNGGIVAKGDLEVSESATPAMSVSVAAGQVWIPGTEDDFQGVYSFENRAAVTLTISAADETNARKDVIVAHVQDSDYSGSSDLAELAVITGVASASPAEPARGENAWVLALIDVAADATSITDSNIMDRRNVQTEQKSRAYGVISFSVAQAAAAINLTTSDADITGVSVDVVTQKDNAFALVVISADMETIGTTDSDASVWLSVDGTDQDARATADLHGSSSQRVTSAQAYIVNIATAGTTTFKMRGTATSNTQIRTRSGNTKITGLLFDTGQGF